MRVAVCGSHIDSPNHSPLFAPVIDPTIRTGVTALTTAARAWLGTPE